MSPDHETRVDTGLDSKRLSRFCIGSVSFSGKGRSSVWARPLRRGDFAVFGVRRVETEAEGGRLSGVSSLRLLIVLVQKQSLQVRRLTK
jgi:hypothetical protein